METILKRLQQKAADAISLAFKDLLPRDSELLIPEVLQSTNPQFGDYQCNNALKLSKELKENPRSIAEKIVSHLNTKDESGDAMISKIEIAGPGFINLTIDPLFLSKEMNAVLKNSHLGVPLPKKPMRIIVEFSSPNVAKELHVGHLRSTIIGDCLARLFEFLGHHVIRLNHVGNWGTQFGMLIAYMQEVVPQVLTGAEKTDLPTLMQWYKESKKRFDEDPEFKKRAQLQVVQLQGGDPKSLHAWQIICEISRQAYQEIYDLMDVKLLERGESFYNPYLDGVIQDLEKKGLITISDGAKCVFLEGFESREGKPLPMIVQKSDGGYNYETTDMAALKHRIREEKAERIIIVTDAGQSLHFQMVFKAAEKVGYLDPKKVQVDHVTFGVVLGPDGKKFKTRAGDTEKLIDLLREAIVHAKKLLVERLTDVSEKEIDEIAAVLGIDAVKYADLSCHRQKDYVFSYDRMLKFDGNTAAFLLYAYVRINGIKRKVQKNIDDVMKIGRIELKHPSEIILALHLRQFGETLEMVARDLLPNRLSDYLYVLAEKFHAFFRDCRVEGDPQEDSRLLLCEATARILKQGLNILGLKTIDRM
ncbi:MAG TPA: arginine--tRNA ligase [Rhabdochlamydiaceae bacterium]|nr:arginine--tRNA ligase [Rhabdochlamydiaceae bacterium]